MITTVNVIEFVSVTELISETYIVSDADIECDPVKEPVFELKLRYQPP